MAVGVLAGSWFETAMSRIQEPQTQRVLLKLLVPFAIAGLGFAVLLSLGVEIASRLIATLGLYGLTPLGKSLAVSFGIGLFTDGVPGFAGLDWGPEAAIATTVALILFWDAWISLFVVWNFDHVRRWRWAGQLLERAESTVARYRWLHGTAFFGLLLFTVLPIYGTGPISTPIVGRLIGLSPRSTWLVVVAGSVLRSTLLGLATIGVIVLLGLA